MQAIFYILDQNGVLDVYIISKRRVKNYRKEDSEEKNQHFLEIATIFHANGYEIRNFLHYLDTGCHTRAVVSGNLDKFTRVVVQVRDPEKNPIDYRG